MIYFAYPGDLETATGGYHYDRRLIGELRGMGVEVETVALPNCSGMPDQETLNSVGQTLAAIPDQSVVVIDGLAFGVLDEVAVKEARRLRLVALCHHPLALETGLDERSRQSLLISERRALECASATIVTSGHTRQILIDQYAVPTERISVALPGTDQTSFAPCDGDPIRLLTLASLTRRKAHDVLIEALAPLESLPWQARFVGGMEFDPAWAKSLQERANKLGLSQRIEFAGTVEDAQAEYQHADVFVLPSRFEGYGMVFAEALAAGLPLIAARSGAVPDVVPEAAGLLVAPDDVDGLNAALQQILTSATLRQTLQAGARKVAVTLPSWTDTASLVARKLEEVKNS
ncbi:MAG: glycosyltransferase family 4 protein [Gammaproteobacteria bacterium]|jgi:glycosyltransferase involved in cell wall biosynthesis|nr:glycosyltransferase family 4 protein [Gammaproteobacteria bacterium]